MQDFRKLLVWQRAHALAIAVDQMSRGFPRPGGGALRGQLSRAADSIAANIAEGCGASSSREFARYLDIAIKSTSETQHHLLSAGDRGLIPRTACDAAVDESVEIRRMLHGLRKRVLGALSPPPRTATKLTTD